MPESNHRFEHQKPGNKFEQQGTVVIDAKNAMLGRLASVVAKQLLNGKRIVCVRTEEINISGSLYRNQVIMARFFKHRCNINPQHGPQHYRSPSRILHRVIRGMLQHKTARGVAALERLQVVEGVPHPYDKVKKVVVPAALRNSRLKPNRAYCRLGDLSTKCGWKHDELVKRLESKRRDKAAFWFAKKQAVTGLQKQAKDNLKSELASLDKQM